MQTQRMIATLVATLGCALTLSACNDASKSARERETRTTAALDTRIASPQTNASSAALPDAVPVPPASSSAIVTGAVEAPSKSAETPVAFAKPEATGGEGASAPGADQPTSPSSSESGKSGVDSAATNPMGTLDKEEQSKSMPMAGQGNNHSSPALEQGAGAQGTNAESTNAQAASVQNANGDAPRQ